MSKTSESSLANARNHFRVWPRNEKSAASRSWFADVNPYNDALRSEGNSFYDRRLFFPCPPHYLTSCGKWMKGGLVMAIVDGILLRQRTPFFRSQRLRRIFYRFME
jgi:hypothetical protein